MAEQTVTVLMASCASNACPTIHGDPSDLSEVVVQGDVVAPRAAAGTASVRIPGSLGAGFEQKYGRRLAGSGPGSGADPAWLVVEGPPAAVPESARPAPGEAFVRVATRPIPAGDR